MQAQYNEAKAQINAGKNRRQIAWQYLKDIFVRLNVVGLILVMAMFGHILVSFTLAGGTKLQWGKAKILCPLIIGFALIPPVILYKVKFAKNPLVPVRALKVKSIRAGMTITTLQMVVWWMPADYMYTLLIVGVNQSIALATRRTSLGEFVYTITGTIVGFFVAKFRHTQPLIIAGVLICFVAVGMLVHFCTGLSAYGG